MSKSIWYNPDHDFIGSTGVDTIEELAALVVQDGEVAELFDAPATVESVVEALDAIGVEPFIIPSAHLYRESYDTGYSWPCSIDARPGRGYVKVVGVHR